MSKNIIFCADGTWNGPDDSNEVDAEVTNVFKLFSNLAGDELALANSLAEREKALVQGGKIVQVAKYLHGVGDSTNPLKDKIGGAFGAGVTARILRGYTFICRNYVPGDKIFIVGFSRGAYTARALASWVCTRGILDVSKHDLTNKIFGYGYAATEWQRHRHDQLQSNRPELLEDFATFTQNLWNTLAGWILPVDPQNLIDAPIDTVAVWDTVGALGVPIYNFDNERRDLFQFCDGKLHRKVAAGYHAVSLDEVRGDFSPTLWDDDPPRIKQRLFPGAHSDVGGGYPLGESGLSDCALRWMIDTLEGRGVNFTSPLKFDPKPNPSGIIHREWLKNNWAWRKHREESRSFPPSIDVDPSVFARMKAGPVPVEGAPDKPYTPPNLPGEHAKLVAPIAG